MSNIIIIWIYQIGVSENKKHRRPIQLWGDLYLLSSNRILSNHLPTPKLLANKFRTECSFSQNRLLLHPILKLWVAEIPEKDILLFQTNKVVTHHGRRTYVLNRSVKRTIPVSQNWDRNKMIKVEMPPMLEHYAARDRKSVFHQPEPRE